MTKKKATVDQTALFSVDHTALFYWSMSTEKHAAVDIDDIFQTYCKVKNKIIKRHLNDATNM